MRIVPRVKWSHRPALDGVRALAIYLVLFFHSGMLAFDGGFVGVDLFFVLSGFLVTSVLFSEIDATGSLRLGQFYARRVRRLLPAAVVVVVATGFVFVLFTSVVRRLTLVGDAQSALLYYANWHFLGQSDDYFASTLVQQPLPALLVVGHRGAVLRRLPGGAGGAGGALPAPVVGVAGRPRRPDGAVGRRASSTG